MQDQDGIDRFRRESRLSYATGAADDPSLQLDSDSLASMQRWCMTSVHARQIPGVGHELMSGASFSASLSELMRPTSDTSSSQTCWSHLINDVDAKLDNVERTIRSNSPDARDQLIKIDRQYGGLAAPRIVTLAREAGYKGP